MAMAKIDLAILDEQQAAETAEAVDEGQVVSYGIAQLKYLLPAKATSDRLLAEAALTALEINLDLQVTNAFVGGLAADRFLALAQNAAGRAEDQVALANKLYQAGMAAFKDVLDAEAKRAEVLAGVVSARKGLELARIGLARLTGLAPGDLPSLDPAGASNAAPVINVAEAIAAATSNRYEAMQAREYVALAELNLELAQTYPSGSYSALQAEAQLRSALYGQQAQLEELEFQVRVAQLDLDAARQLTVLYEPAVVAAREGLRLAGLRYEAGMAINLEVLVAGLNLASAEANYQNAIYQEMTAVAKLAHASSRGSQSVYPGAVEAQ
jgi:outer membrane protein TolC